MGVLDSLCFENVDNQDVFLFDRPSLDFDFPTDKIGRCT